jgi:hypothetical protein
VTDAQVGQRRDRALVGPILTGQDAQQGRLAGPVGADQSGTFAIIEIESYGFEYKDIAETFGNMIDGQQGILRHDASSTHASQWAAWSIDTTRDV